MANRGKKTKSIEFIIGLIILILIAILSESGIIPIEKIFNSENSEILDSNEISKRVTAEESENVTLEGEDILQIHFFDVGQADSTLIISDNKTMLIDAGTNEMGSKVVANIKKLGIEKIDYLIGTHPHEDHIGGLDDVIKNFEIGTIYMPKIQTNTKTFEDVLDAITEKNLTITTPKEGDKFELGKAECEIMLCGTGTKEEKENLNLSSIVTKVTYGKQSYLFMGDSEKENEQSRTWPKVNVLKVGHHGSNTSSSKEFLDQVLPQIAIISVGKDNSYGHPKQVILDRLNKIGALIYTTKDKGNILIESDGNNNKVSFYILGNLS